MRQPVSFRHGNPLRGDRARTPRDRLGNPKVQVVLGRRIIPGRHRPPVSRADIEQYTRLTKLRTHVSSVSC